MLWGCQLVSRTSKSAGARGDIVEVNCGRGQAPVATVLTQALLNIIWPFILCVGKGNVLVLVFDYNCGVKGQSGWRNMENWTKPEWRGRQKEAQALLICPNALGTIHILRNHFWERGGFKKANFCLLLGGVHKLRLQDLSFFDHLSPSV